MDIIVEFSGWCRVDSTKVKFVHIGTTNKPDISGVEWCGLSEDKKQEYILESVITAQQLAEDGDYDCIEWFKDTSKHVDDVDDIFTEEIPY